MTVKYLVIRKTWVYSIFATLFIASNTPEIHAQDTSSIAATSTCFTVNGCAKEPIVDEKIEPEHILSKEYTCSNPSINAASSFKVCNEELETIRVMSFVAGNPGSEFAKLLAPKLPIELAPNACREFVIEAGEKNPYKCGGFFDVILNIESKSINGKIEGIIAIGL